MRHSPCPLALEGGRLAKNNLVNSRRLLQRTISWPTNQKHLLLGFLFAWQLRRDHTRTYGALFLLFLFSAAAHSRPAADQNSIGPKERLSRAECPKKRRTSSEGRFRFGRMEEKRPSFEAPHELA